MQHRPHDDASRLHALNSARDAVRHIEDTRSETPSMFGRLALVTWGCIALASAVFALSVALSPPRDTLVAESAPAEVIAEEADEVPAVDTALRPEDFDETVTGAAQTAMPDLYGGQIGRDVSVSQLADRYSSIAARMPVLFDGLDPLIRIEEETADLEASLVAGPFETMDDARLFCRTMRLQLTIECEATPYEGETFLRR